MPLVDATFVSPVGRDGTARAGADRMPGKAATDAARRKYQATVPGAFGRPWVSLVVLAVEVGGRLGTAMADFLHFQSAGGVAVVSGCNPTVSEHSPCHP